MTEITQERLRELFDYQGGSLIRKVDRGRGGGARWPAGTRGGHPIGLGYVGISIDGSSYKLHRLVWLWHHGEFPSAHIDHINGNPSDNRIENLRAATSGENAQNQRKARTTNTLGVQGVCKVGNRYRAAVHKDYKKHHLGYFDTPEEAHSAYLDAKRHLHEFNTL